MRKIPPHDPLNGDRLDIKYGSKRRNKYGVAPKEQRMVDGIMFDSKAEATRFKELQLLERAGKIVALQCQHKLPFEYKERKVFTYIADFVYRDIRIGRVVIEDVKGVKTAVYRLKKKLIELQYGIVIEEVDAKRRCVVERRKGRG